MSRAMMEGKWSGVLLTAWVFAVLSCAGIGLWQEAKPAPYTEAEQVVAAAIQSCDGEYEISTTVMDARQVGVPLPNMLGISPEPWQRRMVLDAYDVPRETDPDRQAAAVQRFAERMLVRCWREGR